MLCVQIETYNFCLNGSLIGPIAPEKGLTERSSLSLSFEVCAEGLSNAIDVKLIMVRFMTVKSVQQPR